MAGIQETVFVCERLCPFMSVCFEKELVISVCVSVCDCAPLRSFGTCNTICEGNRKLLEWMRGK